MVFIFGKFQKYFLLPLLWKGKIVSLLWVRFDLTFGARAITRATEYLLKPRAQILMSNRKLQEPTSKYSNHLLAGTEFTVCYYFPTYYYDFFFFHLRDKDSVLWLSEQTDNRTLSPGLGTSFGRYSRLLVQILSETFEQLQILHNRIWSLDYCPFISAAIRPQAWAEIHKNALNMVLQYRLKSCIKKIDI